MGRGWMPLALAAVLAVSLTACGTGNDETDGAMAGQAGYSRTGRAGYTVGQRGVDDYMEDGRYTVGSDGQVRGTDRTPTRDLSKKARDMLRDAENAARDVGRGVERATEDIMNG